MEKVYYLLFSLSPGIGVKRFKTLISKFSSAEKAWHANLDNFEKLGIGKLTFEKFAKFRDSFDINLYLKKLKEKEVSYLTPVDEFYPENLKKIENPPIVLYIKVHAQVANKIFSESERDKTYSFHKLIVPSRSSENFISSPRVIAVVGTRKMTRYGQEVTEKLVSELVALGFVIVSGLALGVDACAHKTTVENGGKTIAVLGCGVDCCYPRENEFLYQQIINGNGAVISTFPLSTQPSKGTFPARNEIISALSNGVLVTEAGEDSGSLITASFAKEQGKPIFAVPGPITSKQSQGTAKLLKNGAILIQNVEDILNHFNVKKPQKVHDFQNSNLSAQEKIIIKLLENETMNINSIAKITGIKITELNIILSMLEMNGFIKNSGSGEFRIA